MAVARDGSDLCLQCGLCCDGTLFTDIQIRADEREFVESLGFVTEIGSDEVLRTPEPCPAFDDGCCSLYGQGRPQTCGSYECRLLEAYVGGQTGLDEALAVVRLVWLLARRLEGEMAMPFGTYDRRAVRRYLQERRPAEAPFENARFLVSFHRLNLLGERYFGYKAKPVEEEASDAGAKVAAQAGESAVSS